MAVHSYNDYPRLKLAISKTHKVGENHPTDAATPPPSPERAQTSPENEGARATTKRAQTSPENEGARATTIPDRYSRNNPRHHPFNIR
ncbi:hypothetical protein QE152_g33209 [Popillia japonica]|uniref:Uncharacterized protein n=1 Tax=Popillia japonica TaxID=7064 RepID=A0AAW1IXJ5_POPJA